MGARESPLYIRQTGGDVQGPFERERIRAWIAAGRVQPTMELSEDGQAWLAAFRFSDLFPSDQPEADLVRVRIKSFDSLRRPGLSGEGAVAVEHGGITLVPSQKSRWDEKHIPGAFIFDLRAEGKNLWFECNWDARGASEGVRDTGHYPGTSMPARLHFCVRPREASADTVISQLPEALARPRCRDCGARVGADDRCTSCGVGFASAFRKRGLTKLIGGPLLAAGVVAVAAILGIPERAGIGRTFFLAFVGASVGAGMATASVGALSLTIGPRFRLFFLKPHGAALVVGTAFVLFVLGLFAAAQIF